VAIARRMRTEQVACMGKFVKCVSEINLKRIERHGDLGVGCRTVLQLILTLQNPVVTTCTNFFNILELCILPTECIYVFLMVLTVNSEFSLNSINRLGFVAEK
jgi:hypothetical protein